jgi:hypothetical protein
MDCGKSQKVNLPCGCVQVFSLRCNKTIKLGLRVKSCGTQGKHDLNKGDYVELFSKAVKSTKNERKKDT